MIKIDTTGLPFGKHKRIRSEAHLAYIRSLPCCVSLTVFTVQAAHISKGTDAGKALKASDCWTVPLSAKEHAKQHNRGEVTFWNGYGGIERAKKLAQDLYAVSGDMKAGKKLVWNFYYGASR